MKKFTLLFILLPFLNLAQNYQPFNASGPKRFVNTANAADNDIYFYAQKSSTQVDTVFYKHYYQRTDQLVNVNGTYCSGWGGAPATFLDSTWLGRDFRFITTDRRLLHSNVLGQTLNFDFGLPLGDSALFYQDANNDYYIKHWQNTEENVLGYTDSVQWFRIGHYDNVGTPITSYLHNFSIQLGQDLGLITFMDCYHFPALEKGVTLMGQVTPRIGNYQMTYEDAFTFDTGDTLVYLGLTPFPYAPPQYGMYYQSVLKYTVTNRVETTDSVYIYLDSAEQIIYPYDTATLTYVDPNEFYNIRYPSPFKFAKRTVLFEQPMNAADSIFTFYQRDTTNVNQWCGAYPQEKQVGDYSLFCDSCSCLTQADGFMQSYYNQTYTAQHGLTYRGSSFYGPYPIYPRANLIYFNISGVGPCGTPVNLGLNEEENQVVISPNPANEYVEIKSNSSFEGVELYSLSGQKVLSNKQTGLETRISLSGIEPGLYTLRIVYSDHSISKKIVVK